MGDTSGRRDGVGGRMSDPRQGYGVGGGMVGRGDECGMGEGMVGVGDGCGMGEGMVGVGDGYGVDEGMVGLGDRCRVNEGMVGLGDGCGVDTEGSRVRTTRGVATGRRGGDPVGTVFVLGPSVVLGPAGVAASSFGSSGIGGCTQSRRCTAVSTSVMSVWSSVPTG